MGAAVLLDRLGIQPQAVAILAKVVRSGGVRYAAELREPVPGEEAVSMVRAWLEAVAELLSLRRVHRSRAAGE